MINIQFNNETVKVRFTYRSGEKRGMSALRTIQNKRITTEAEISAKGPDGQWRTLAVGEAVRDPHDQFTKALGRRIALGRAVVQLGDQSLVDAIWQEYERVQSGNSNQNVKNEAVQEN